MPHQWRFPIEIESNWDGDSFKAMAHTGFGGQLPIRIRLKGCDTPEISKGSPETRALARYARDHVRALVMEADEVLFHSTFYGEREKYGRKLGDILIDGNSLSEHLLAEDLAIPYDGTGSKEERQARHEKNAQAALAAGRITLET